jgi:hypothetical protein
MLVLGGLEAAEDTVQGSPRGGGRAGGGAFGATDRGEPSDASPAEA